MKLICSKCGTVFESLIIDQKLAYQEVFNQSAKHVQHRHKDMFAEMQKSIALGINSLTTFMHMNEFCIVPEDQVRITAALEQAQEIGLACFGFDPEDELDPEEREDGSDGVEGLETNQEDGLDDLESENEPLPNDTIAESAPADTITHTVNS